MSLSREKRVAVSRNLASGEGALGGPSFLPLAMESLEAKFRESGLMERGEVESVGKMGWGHIAGAGGGERARWGHVPWGGRA